MGENKYRRYTEEIIATLYNFQLIEMALKIYISKAIKIIKDKTSGTVPFKYTEKWVENDSLGKLIQKFEKLSDNSRLIEELKKIKPRRDAIAHQGLLLSVEDWEDNLLVAFKIRELREVLNITRLILSRIRVEFDKISK